MPEAHTDGTELFVYYRVPVTACAVVAAAVGTMQQALRAQHSGLEARLLRRPALHDGHATFMETYAWPGRGIGSGLQAQIDVAAAQALDGMGTGARHTEVFLPCA